MMNYEFVRTQLNVQNDNLIYIANLMLNDKFSNAYDVINEVFTYYYDIFFKESYVDNLESYDMTFESESEINSFIDILLQQVLIKIKDKLTKDKYNEFINKVHDFANKHYAFNKDTTLDNLLDELMKYEYDRCKNFSKDELIDYNCISTIVSTIEVNCYHD